GGVRVGADAAAAADLAGLAAVASRHAHVNLGVDDCSRLATPNEGRGQRQPGDDAHQTLHCLIPPYQFSSFLLCWTKKARCLYSGRVLTVKNFAKPRHARLADLRGEWVRGVRLLTAQRAWTDVQRRKKVGPIRPSRSGPAGPFSSSRRP